jgi:hypothetical protein
LAVDPSVAESPEWWLIRLGRRLHQDRDRVKRLEDYHAGDHPLPDGNRKMRDTYRRFQKMSRSNFVGLVTEAVLERLTVVGFSTGAGGDEDADAAAWLAWQRNSMDADLPLVLRQSLVCGRSYVTVGRRNDGTALLTGEDAKQVMHESDPTDRRRVRASIKVYRSGDWDKAVVMLPDGVVYFRAPKMDEIAGYDPFDPTRWERDPDEGDADSVGPNPVAPFNPVVPFLNRPTLDGKWMGEFEDVTDIQDRINTVVLDRLVISAMQAYRQRWAKGIEVDDEFDPGADLLWSVENDNAAFGEFQAADLRQVLEAASQDIRHLAAITRTPPHYLVGELNNVNGETLKATETGLVAKANERSRQFGESAEMVNRLGGLIEGREVPVDAETLWADPQSHSLAELYDSAVKGQSAGVPWAWRMRLLGFTPQQIRRMEADRAAEAMMADLFAPLPPQNAAEAEPADAAVAN